MRHLLIALLLLASTLGPASAQPPGYEFVRHRSSLVRLAPETLPWRVFVSDPRFYQVSLHALRSWNEAGHRLGMPDLFAPVDQRSDADMVIDWSGAGLPGDKAGGVFWDYSEDSPRVLGLSMDPHYNVPDGNRVQILLQELGHCLGLDHSERPGDAMYHQSERRRFRSLQDAKLSSRDLEAFRWLYSQSQFQGIAPGRLQVSNSQVNPSTVTLAPPGSGPSATAATSLLIEPLRVEINSSINVRVAIKNTSTETILGPLVLEFWGRTPGESRWLALKSWNDISRVPAGYRVAKDYFSPKQPLFMGRYELLTRVYRADSGEVLAESVERH